MEAHFTEDEMEGKTLADILNDLQAKGIESINTNRLKLKKVLSQAMLSYTKGQRSINLRV